ncbi:aspartate ammonia-lyase [Enterococcus florum]|uniref:Aspartate ammonia-lyase n=1 Tax=Enterococcus florum TaxID=2480627 RepID=A0A4P5PDF3_9ENTE|nr:aspartate ammonia-lyase [Enterococcus florum]GCF94058.1 aspartate ammonia-lyase [Enterococcus florum]
MKTRIETDSIGKRKLPKEAYYGIHAQRAKENFSISKEKLHPLLIKHLAHIKQAAARTNQLGGALPQTIGSAIETAAAEMAEGIWNEQIIVDSIQGGAGTSANMNVNEVLANRALELIGKEKGSYQIIHPNDHVNMCQSTNDVFPSAGKLAMAELLEQLLTELRYLDDSLFQKKLEFADVAKIGRTQLQEAVPTSLGASFGAFQAMIHRDILRIQAVREKLFTLNLSGTAIGTQVNTTKYYRQHILETLQHFYSDTLFLADDLVEATQNLDVFVEISGCLKTLAVGLSKICNDLRLLSSGPHSGFAELALPICQAGSSIMPGKINPVIPEVVSQVAFHVIGNDLTVTMAVEGGQLELNAFQPILFHDLFASIELLSNAGRTLTNSCILGIEANQNHCAETLANSDSLITAIAPLTGYEHATILLKEARKSKKPVSALIKNTKMMSDQRLAQFLDLPESHQPTGSD